MSEHVDTGYKDTYYKGYGITPEYWGEVSPKGRAAFINYAYGTGNAAPKTTYSANNNIIRGIGTNNQSGSNTTTPDTSFGSAFNDGLAYGQIGKDASGNLVKGGFFSNSALTEAEASNYESMLKIGKLDNPTLAQQEDYRNFMKSQEGLGTAGLQTGIQAASALYQGLVADPANRKIARDQVAATQEANKLNRDKFDAYKESGRNKSALINSIIG